MTLRLAATLESKTAPFGYLAPPKPEAPLSVKPCRPQIRVGRRLLKKRQRLNRDQFSLAFIARKPNQFSKSQLSRFIANP